MDGPGCGSVVSAARDLSKACVRVASRAAGGGTRKWRATLRRRASRCLLLAVLCCRAASRRRSTGSSSSDHTCWPSFRLPENGLLCNAATPSQSAPVECAHMHSEAESGRRAAVHLEAASLLADRLCTERAWAEPGRSGAARAEVARCSARSEAAEGTFFECRRCLTTLSISLLLMSPPAVTSVERPRRPMASRAGTGMGSQAPPRAGSCAAGGASREGTPCAAGGPGPEHAQTPPPGAGGGGAAAPGPRPRLSPPSHPRQTTPRSARRRRPP
jgi:hypothetical protein